MCFLFFRNPINRYAEHVEEAPNTAGFRQYSPAHQDAVMSVAAVRPGVTLSGSKDKVYLCLHVSDSTLKVLCRRIISFIILRANYKLSFIVICRWLFYMITQMDQSWNNGSGTTGK